MAPRDGRPAAHVLHTYCFWRCVPLSCGPERLSEAHPTVCLLTIAPSSRSQGWWLWHQMNADGASDMRSVSPSTP